jgi:hypothetical protein
MTEKIAVSAGFRTRAEQDEAKLNKNCFNQNPESWEKKMENFPKYVRRQDLTRFIALYNIFKRIINIKGSIVECGVYQGFGIMTWAKLSAILEPVNLTRRIYGFDSFEGFPLISKKDKSPLSNHIKKGELYANSFKELQDLNAIHDKTRFLGHISKVKLIPGDAMHTIPNFIEEHPHILISLLFLDFDLYEPTRVALENFLPRMPKGAVLAFDELDNPLWPGETQAMLDVLKDRIPRIERFDFDPYIGFVVLD